MTRSKYALEEQLIMEVESHRILYDKSNPDHKYKNKIQNVWKEISYVLGEDVSGGKGGKKKEWILYKKMLFLVPYTEITGNESNYSAPPSTSESQESEGFEEIACVHDMSELEVPSEEFSVPISHVRGEQDKTRDHVAEKLPKVLDNFEKQDYVPKQLGVFNSTIFQLFSNKSGIPKCHSEIVIVALRVLFQL
ncbi:hypothetical protein Bhyg_03330 [Pseudolycoriella hygida]|uniref:MADF domain-containing protein n=1 Tax=Pseudolycoriella hygida TaxID=35572 RepID=A0A9Q0ND60_9DIPT|nr:hypothetical protein Bhyg_03330 [Pseudolycoriella hygida]